jgi:rSAM/selenodomain-associated transferase 1
MTIRYPDSCLIQFAKAPLQGQVKTRMQSALGENGCLKLHKSLVEHQFSLHHQSGISDFELWCSADHPFFDQLVAETLVEKTRVPVYVQQGEDLGQRMHNVFIDRFRQYSYVILIGSDCPFLGGDYVTDAINRLKQGVPAVFGPATDGGYVLIGLSRVDVSLFEGIQWGTDEVMAQTRDRLKALDWQWEELPHLSDIDRPEDLELLFCDEKLRVFLE